MKKKSKHLVSIVLSVSAFLSLCTLDSAGAVPEMENSGVQVECGTESCVTSGSLEKFNEHIGQLRTEDSEQAELILKDEELVAYMSREDYWQHADEIQPESALRAVSLPLTAYPAGSYYTYNGSACTCHDGDTYIIPSGYSTSRCYNQSTGSSGNCKRYNGAIQCMGFAHYVFKQYNGVDCSSSNENAGLSVLNDASLKFYFTSVVKVGGHARGTLKSGTPHSIIVTKVTNSGISYYQSNYGGYCKVSTGTKTWEEISNWFNDFYISWSV